MSASFQRSGDSEQMTVIINVRNPHGGDTYVARAKEYGTRASSTSCSESAVRACARKIGAGRTFELERVTGETWLCRIAVEHGGGR